MPCNTSIKEQMRLARLTQDKAKEKALKELELAREVAAKILAEEIIKGKRTVTRDLKGKLAISNWNTTLAYQVGFCEPCVVDTMLKLGNWVLNSKLANVGVTSQNKITK